MEQSTFRRRKTTEFQRKARLLVCGREEDNAVCRLLSSSFRVEEKIDFFS
jgi:hypothetical protein